jgi:hypothetical protein
MCGFTDSAKALTFADQCGCAMNMSSRMKTEEVLRHELAVLEREHRDLDEAIIALEERPMPDQLQIRRLKKQKLKLKEEIQTIRDRLYPDIIA